MISTSIQNTLQTVIRNNLGTPVSDFDVSMVGGGSINKTYQIVINKKEKFFCKINTARRFPLMFEKEKRGLELLASKQIIRVPSVIGTFIEDDQQVLLLEWIEQGIKSGSFWKLFGEQLAALHSIPCINAGLEEDNYMGALAQSNHPSPNWIDFFIQQRLEPQIRLALGEKLLLPQHHKQFEKMYNALPGIFPPVNLSLLHGDLWSGNFLCNHAGNPVLIDPAVYRGHPAMDLAMTTLFGGFDAAFYKAYNRHLPFSSNHHQQWEICNLYPLLIHLNLFGKRYLQSILSTIQYY